MKRVLTIAVLTAAVSLLLVGGAFAGTQDGTVFTLHAKNTTTKNSCTTYRPNIACSNYLLTWPVFSNTYVYLVTAQSPDAVKGIAGISCGIDYTTVDGDPATSGLYMYAFTLCADLQFTNAGVNGEWPAAGGGNRITWVSDTNCQQTVYAPDGVHAIAGFFYVYAYSPDKLQVTPNLNLEIPELAVADCAASTTYLPMDGSATGWVGFGQPGCNPCIEDCAPPIATETTTWGRVKTQF